MDDNEDTRKLEDIAVILEVLHERGEPLTLPNAQLVLFVGLKNKPAAWTITAEELPALWTALVEEVAAEAV